MSRIRDESLAQQGKRSHMWARRHMRMLSHSIESMAKSRPLEGVRLAFCLQLTKETSVLIAGAKRLGAEVAACGGNPLTTQDDIAAFLHSEGVAVYGWSGQSQKEYSECQDMVLSHKPHIITDDGGDLNAKAHLDKRFRALRILGATEETTTGVTRYLAMQKRGMLRYPIIAVNNAKTKMMFDNRYGTGQSVVDSLLRASGLLLASKRAVVAGYGWLGKGVAKRLSGMGCKVAVTEVDPVKALEAHMDGFEVVQMDQAAKYGDIFVTCTGMRDIITKRHILSMKDGAILANAGHFDVEIDSAFLLKSAAAVRPHLDKCLLPNRKSVYLVGRGRVANLVASEGHPPDVMDLSFSNQLYSILYVLKNHKKMQNRVYGVPEEIDRSVALGALKSCGIKIDALSKSQMRYGTSW